MRVLSIVAAVSLISVGAAEAATFRIAAITGKSAPCHSLTSSAPAGQIAYYKHLAGRLGQDVQECPVANEAAAGRALESGALDMAVLGPAGFEPVKAKTRSILTVRPVGDLNRIPVLVATRKTSSRTSLAGLKGGTVVFAGKAVFAYSLPRKALADRGAGPGFFAREDVAADPETAAAKLRSGAVDALVINAAAWQRLCRGDRPQDATCGDLKVIWRGRPRAAKAIVVRRDIEDELRFRLIGLHVAMHLEAKDAFAWGSSWIPKAAEFEPTEADALVAP
jgi:hypothetical protein